MASATSYWERDLSRLAPKTKSEYEYHLQRFLTWAELTHEGLYEKHKANLEVEDARDADEIENLVKDFMTAMENGEIPDAKGQLKKYSQATLNQFLKAVASFFTSNKLAFSSKKLRRRPHYTGVVRISTEEIRQLHDEATGLGKTRSRNRALYMFAKDSGLRVSDISALTVEAYLGARTVEVGGAPYKVFEPFKTQKTGDVAYCIVGAEAIHATDKMLGSRRTGPLFLSDEGERWTAQAMTAHCLYVRRTVFKNESRVSAHSFRKTHKTTLEGQGIPQEWVRLLQGKSADVYSRPQDGPELLEAYAKAYPALRTLPSRHLEAEVKDQKQKLDALTQYILENTQLTPQRLQEYQELHRRDKAGEDILEATHPHTKENPKPKDSEE